MLSGRAGVPVLPLPVGRWVCHAAYAAPLLVDAVCNVGLGMRVSTYAVLDALVASVASLLARVRDATEASNKSDEEENKKKQ